jgi:anti-sigma factor RsiW
MAPCESNRQISAYHDGELPAGAARELAEHIRHCPSCRQELERLRSLSQWLAAAPMPEAPEALLERLRRSVQPRRDRIALRVAEALTAVAAVVLVACSAMLYQRSRPRSAPVQPVARWERLAAEAIPDEPTTVAGDMAADTQTDTEADTDVQIARSILGAVSTGGG